MAKKDKQSKAVDVVESNQAAHVLSPLQLSNLLRFDAEMRAATSDFGQAAEKRKELLDKIDPQGEVDKFGGIMNKSQRAFLTFQAKRDLLVKEIEAQFGISMKEYAFDDETGTLSFVQPEQKVEESNKGDKPEQPTS